MPHAEALTLLSPGKTCQDPADWVPSKVQLGTHQLSNGILGQDGSFCGLTVQLVVHRGPKTNMAQFRFDLFKVTISGPEPVYSLHIKTAPKALKAAHNMPHEHIGDLRVTGDASWLKWGYPEALARFCERTGIEFIPPPLDPEEYRLR